MSVWQSCLLQQRLDSYKVMAWCCKAHKTEACVKMRFLVALALHSYIPAGISIRMTMTYQAKLWHAQLLL